MNVSAIDSSASARIAAMYASGPLSAAGGSGSTPTLDKTTSSKDPAAIKKAVQQFEAIILRQLLEPSIQPVMSGGLGGAEGAGGGIYGYMLTDALAGSMAQGGGLGLARVLERQLAPAGAAAPEAAIRATTSHQLHPLKTS